MTGRKAKGACLENDLRALITLKCANSEVTGWRLLRCICGVSAIRFHTKMPQTNSCWWVAEFERAEMIGGDKSTIRPEVDDEWESCHGILEMEFIPMSHFSSSSDPDQKHLKFVTLRWYNIHQEMFHCHHEWKMMRNTRNWCIQSNTFPVVAYIRLADNAY